MKTHWWLAPPTMSTIAENIAAIRARIDAAARQTGRTGADITLVAAGWGLICR